MKNISTLLNIIEILQRFFPQGISNLRNEVLNRLFCDILNDSNVGSNKKIELMESQRTF